MNRSINSDYSRRASSSSGSYGKYELVRYWDDDEEKIDLIHVKEQPRSSSSFGSPRRSGALGKTNAELERELLLHSSSAKRRRQRERMREVLSSCCCRCFCILCCFFCCFGIILPGIAIGILALIAHVECRNPSAAFSTFGEYDAAGVTALKVNSVVGNVYLTTGNTTQYQVTITRKAPRFLQKISASMSVSEGTLQVGLSFSPAYLLGCPTSDINIIAPHSALSNASIYSKYGSVTVEDISLNTLIVSTTIGSATLQNARVSSTAAMDTKAGSISVFNVTAGDSSHAPATVKLSSFDGDISVTNVGMAQVNDTLSLSSTKGSFVISEFSGGSITTNNVDGGLNINVLKPFTGTYNLHSKYGHVHVNGTNVQVTNDGDHTQAGNVNHGTSADQRITATTTWGNLAVTFL